MRREFQWGLGRGATTMSKRAPENIAEQGFWEEEPQAEGSKPREKRAAGETGFAATRRSLRAIKGELLGKSRE